MEDLPDELPKRLGLIEERISFACQRSGRKRQDVELIAVSKTFPAEAIREAQAAGQTVFGESRIQEAAPKIEEISGELDWHFIGRVQRNKVRKILPICGTIHAIDSLRLAIYLDSVAKDLELRPSIFIQVNIGEEESKGGFSVTEIKDSIVEIAALQFVEVSGLMCIPPAGDEPESARIYFKEMRQLRDELATLSPLKLHSLSMGMSQDFEVAIEEGATHVRVGSAIFGGRTQRVPGELGN